MEKYTEMDTNNLILNYNNKQEINKQEILRKALFIKDMHSISDNTYHNFVYGLKLNLPNKDSIKAERKRQDTTSLLINSNSYGVYIDIIPKIILILRNIMPRMINDKKILEINGEYKLRIRFSTDSLNCGQTKILPFFMSFIDDDDTIFSQFGIFVLGLFIIESETYKILKECLKELLSQMDQLNSVEIDSKQFKFEKFFSADLKMIAILKGLLSANSLHPCVYCTKPQKVYHNRNLNLNFSIIERNNDARTVDHQNEVLRDKPTLGYKNSPLTVMPFKNMIFCILHFYLRVTDKLVSIFINSITDYDTKMKNNNYFDKFKFLCHQLKIKNAIYKKINEKNKKTETKVRSMSGDEKLRLFSNIDLIHNFALISKISEIQKVSYFIFSLFISLRLKIIFYLKLWSDFNSMYTQIKKN